MLCINYFKAFDLIPVIKLQHLEYCRLNTDMTILKENKKRTTCALEKNKTKQTLLMNGDLP